MIDPKDFKKIAQDILNNINGIYIIANFTTNTLIDHTLVLKLLTTVRDSIEVVHTAEYGNFLAAFFPTFAHIITKTDPQNTKDTPLQKIRNLTLEIMHRFPCTEILKPYSIDMMKLCMDVTQNDNEENAVLGIKMMMNLHKSFRKDGQLVYAAQPFLDFVNKLYGNFPETVREIFEQNDKKKEKTYFPARKSFKVLTECPLLVVLLFQVYPQSAQILPALLPRMISSFYVQLKPPAPNDDRRKYYLDLIAAQVKTASFLAYCLRAYKEEIKPHKENIPKIVCELLLRCPNESISSRKELLVIMRHMIDSQHQDLRPHFLGFIDQLLDDTALLGTSRTSYETLRPLAYSTLADLIHHVRSKLDLPQITKTVTFYTRIMYDPTLALSIQTMSAKLLVHLVESIFKLQGNQQVKEAGRHILVNIMAAFVNKVKSLSKMISRLGEHKEEQKSESQKSTGDGEKGEKKEEEKKDDKKEEKKEEGKKTGNRTLDEEKKDPIDSDKGYKYCRLMVKTLILGLKNVIFVMLSMDAQKQTPGQPSQPRVPKQTDEIKLFLSLFKHGLNCFPVYTMGSNPSPSDEKENLDAFASLFTVLSMKTVQEIFKKQLPYLYTKLLERPSLLTIPTHFLAHSTVARAFSDILLSFLVQKMDKMAGNTNESNVILRLFKLVFGSIVTFPNHETVLKPYLSDIVKRCLANASQSKESMNYLLTLRSLFRSVVGGKFQNDLLCKEFMHLLPLILDRLTELLKTAPKSPIRDLYIELLLTVPAKLHVLCPYLPQLIRPVLYALQGSNELVTFGLRNLDMWVDSLRTESLEPILKPVMPELMLALFSHLRPAPYLHGMLAMKIIAKLGGLNRSHLFIQPAIMEVNELATDGLSVNLQFETNGTSKTFEFPVDKFVQLSRKVFLSSSTDIQSREQAYLFLKACLVSMMKLDENLKEKFNIPDESIALKSMKAFKASKTTLTIYSCNNFFDPYGLEGSKLENKTERKVDAESQLFRLLLSTLFTGVTIPKLKDETTKFIKGICRHFALLTIARCRQLPDPVKDLNPDLFLDALVDTFCHETLEGDTTPAEMGLVEFINVMSTVCGSQDFMLKFRVWEKLASRLCHCCYEREWYQKVGGCRGIICLCKNLAIPWLKKHEIEFVKALLFIIKNSPAQLGTTVIEEATKALEVTITTCHKDKVEDTSKEGNKILHELLLVLVSELSSSHAPVRNAIQHLLKLVSSLTGQTITALLEPFRPSLTKSIVVKRFLHLRVPLQTGFCEAVTFFLSLDPPLLTLTPNIIQIVERALHIYTREKDPQVLLSDIETKEQIALKMACMKLLQRALNTPEMIQPANTQLRNKIIEVFFQYLASSNEKVVEIAKSGLATFIASQRLPKDLLQVSLRPILSNLGSYQKLTLPVLQTLAHLLELCTSYFSVKLGEQLLQHLKHWTMPAKITHLQAGTQPIVAAHILKLFALLPPDAKKFLDTLVNLTIELEKAWEPYLSEFSSPFRKPLAEFLNLYPAETIQFFLGPPTNVGAGAIFNDMNEGALFKLFICTLKHEAAKKIREHLAANPDCIMAIFNFAKNPQLTNVQRDEISFKAIYIVRTIVKFLPEFLVKNRPIVDQLLAHWNHQITQQERDLFDILPKNAKHIRLLLKCFITYCRHKEDEVDILFTMLHALNDKTAADYSFLRDFYKQEVVEYPPHRRKQIFSKFLSIFKDSSVQLKMEALQHLVIEIVKTSFRNGDQAQVFDADLVKMMIETLFTSDSSVNMEESLRVELLQLATLFVRHMPSAVVIYRKEILKFALDLMLWNQEKSEDTTSMQCAYLMASYFIEAYETPEQVILKVYISLLKHYKPEGRALVKKALDILAPALQNRLKAGKHKYPRWISWTHKLLIEEGHCMPQLIHIWQLFVRHSNLFFPYWELFVPQIVNSLERIGLHPNHPIENRILAVDLVELIVQWEQKSRDEKNALMSPKPEQKSEQESDTSKKRKLESSASEDESKAKKLKTEHTTETKSSEPEQSTTKRKEFKTPKGVPGDLVNFLIQIALPYRADLRRSDKTSAQFQQLCLRCIDILKRAFAVWPDVEPKYGPIHQLLEFDTETCRKLDPVFVTTGLEVLKVLIEADNCKVIQDNAAKIGACLKSYLYHEDPKVIQTVTEFLELMLKKYPVKSNQVSSFYTTIWSLISEGIKILAETPQILPFAFGHLAVLKLMNEHSPEEGEKFCTPVFNLFSRMLKEHIAQTHEKLKQSQQQQQRQQQQQSYPHKSSQSQIQMLNQAALSNTLHVQSIGLCIDFLCSRVHDASIRKPLLTSLSHIIDKSNEINVTVMKKIVQELKSLLLKTGNEKQQLSSKEKIYFLAKLSSLEQTLISELKQEYLELLLALYQDKNMRSADADVYAKVEAAFTYGLRSEPLRNREKFLTVLNERVEKNIYHRLRYIFHSKNWEPLCDTFWVRFALDLLLGVIRNEETLSIPDRIAKLNTIVGPKLDETEEGDKPAEKKEPTPEAMKIIEEHSEFIKELQQMKVKNLISPLQELARESIRVSYDLWVNLFPFAWESLNKEQHETLTKPLMALLSRDYHAKQYVRYPNVIQALLEGIHKCKEPIPITLEVLKFLGKSFKTWHIAIPMMEKHLLSKMKSSKKTEQAVNTLVELYRVLSEDGILTGIYRSNNISEYSKLVLSLEQLGLWADAQDALKETISAYQRGTLPRPKITHNELGLWEEHWIKCAKKLQQWSELKKYATKAATAGLMLECFWQEADWNSMKELFSKHPIAENQLLKIYQISLAIMEERRQDALDHLHQATQLALQRWCALPDFLCNSHINMLHNFQQLLELHDSTRFLASYANLTVTELKGFFTTWRDRIPNKWDDVSMWNDILIWRHHFLLQMAKKYASTSVQPHTAFCLNEAIWTMNKFANVTRKHNLTQTSFIFLSESKNLLDQIKTDTSEQFVRVYETVSAYLQEGKYQAALEFIETDPGAQPSKLKHAQMDILRVKAEILSAMGRKEDAYVTFSNAISLFPKDPRYATATNMLSLAKTFLSWGNLLDEQFEAGNCEDLNVAEQLIVSYLQAVRYGSNTARKMIARVFYLLSYDNEKKQLLSIMDKSIIDIPIWIWLPWIDNLFTMLLRKESPIAKIILLNIGKAYPQSIYYHMRSFYFELRDELKNILPQKPPERPATVQKPPQPGEKMEGTQETQQQVPPPPQPQQQAPPQMITLTPKQERLLIIKKHSEELMAQILSINPKMVKEIETLLKEITGRLKPEPEEELQREFEYLLRLCYTDSSFISNQIPQHVITYAQQICSNLAYFPADDCQQAQNLKVSSFLKEVKKEIINDILPPEGDRQTGPKTLLEMSNNIKNWLRKLQNRVNLLPNTLPLENISRYLADNTCLDIEIPGQYSGDREPFVEQHEKILYFSPQVDVLRRNKVSCRRISIRSQSGRLYKFLVQSTPPTKQSSRGISEDRTWSFVSHLNSVLDKNRLSHARNLRMNSPAIIPITQKLRLLHERPSYIALEDIYHDYCAQMGKNVDWPILQFWNLVSTNSSQQDARKVAFKQVLDSIPDNILSEYMTNTCPSWNEYFQLRKRLTIQFSLISLIHHILGTTEQHLHRVLVGKNTGDLFQFDFRPKFGDDGMIKRNETMPFRLTQNIAKFLSPFGVQGDFINAMSIASNAFSTLERITTHLLKLYIRDELISWSTDSLGLPKFGDDEKSMRIKVDENTKDIMKRLKNLAPEHNPLDVVNDNVHPVNERVEELVKIATSVDNLAQTDPTWHPWF